MHTTLYLDFAHVEPRISITVEEMKNLIRSTCQAVI